MRRDCRVSTLKIFASFEYDKDRTLKNEFLGESKTRTNHRVVNSSLREDYPDDKWVKKASEAIRKCDVVIVLIGEDTHNAPGVIVETDIARSHGIPMFQIVKAGNPYKGVKRLEPPIRWRWKQVNDKLDEIDARRRIKQRP